jgi:hypothetical protein
MAQLNPHCQRPAIFMLPQIAPNVCDSRYNAVRFRSRDSLRGSRRTSATHRPAIAAIRNSQCPKRIALRASVFVGCVPTSTFALLL